MKFISYPKYLQISWTSELHEKGKVAPTAAPGKQGHHNTLGMPLEIAYVITGYIIMKIFEISVWHLVHILDENNVKFIGRVLKKYGNVETYCWKISSSINLFFLKSVIR